MEILENILNILATLVIIYRAWSYYVLKSILKETSVKPKFISFLLTEFGRLDNLIFWYVKTKSNNSEINRQELLVNRLTTSFFILVVGIIGVAILK